MIPPPSHFESETSVKSQVEAKVEARVGAKVESKVEAKVGAKVHAFGSTEPGSTAQKKISTYRVTNQTNDEPDERRTSRRP